MLSTTDRNGIAIVTVTEDRIDAAAAIRFKDAIRTTMDDLNGRIVLDMSGVRFVDSSGLGAIVASKKLAGTGRAFDLAGLTPDVDKVFRLTRMNSVFDIYTTVEDAIDLRAAG